MKQTLLGYTKRIGIDRVRVAGIGLAPSSGLIKI